MREHKEFETILKQRTIGRLLLAGGLGGNPLDLRGGLGRQPLQVLDGAVREIFRLVQSPDPHHRPGEVVALPVFRGKLLAHGRDPFPGGGIPHGIDLPQFRDAAGPGRGGPTAY